MITEDITALRTQFVNNWPGGVLTLYDNQPNATIPPLTPYVRFSVRPGASRHYSGSAQNGERLQLGRVWLQILIPHQLGDAQGLALAETFATIFRNKRLDGSKIHVGTEDINVTPNDGHEHYMITVSIPWESYRKYP